MSNSKSYPRLKGGYIYREMSDIVLFPRALGKIPPIACANN